jgi:hypothetical protein
LLILFTLYHICLYVDCRDEQKLELHWIEKLYMLLGLGVVLFRFLQPVLLPKMEFLPLIGFTVHKIT